MSVVNEIARGARLVHHLVKDGYVPVRFSKKHQRRRIQKALQVFQHDVQWGWGMEYTRMSYHPDELINARPGDGPWHGPLGEGFKNPLGLNMVSARRYLGVDQDVGIYGLHRSAPVHQIEEGIAVKQVHTRLFGRFPAAEPQFVPLRTGVLQRATKAIVGQRLEGSAFFRRFTLQLTEKLIVDR